MDGWKEGSGSGESGRRTLEGLLFDCFSIYFADEEVVPRLRCHEIQTRRLRFLQKGGVNASGEGAPGHLENAQE